MSKEKSCLVLKSDVQPFTKPLKKKIKQLQAALDKHRWIPVGERLPGKADFYNIVRFRVDRIVGVAYWNGKAWRKTPNHRYINKITHWRPTSLPEGE